MNTFRNISIVAVLGALAACSSATTPFTPALDGTAQNLGGNYSVTQNGTTVSIASTLSGSTFYGMRAWISSSNPHKGFVYDTSDVLAIAVIDATSGATGAGINGVAAASVPTSGVASYVGGYSGTYWNDLHNLAWNAGGAITTNVDFASGAVTGSGSGTESSSLSVTGTVSGTQFNGTATFAAAGYNGAAQAPMTGGFYGTNTMAGIYRNTDVAGIIWGQN